MLSLVVFSFMSFLAMGIPLAVIPTYLHDQLGYSTSIAGAVIGVQYVATLVFRPLAVRLTDERGARSALLIGMLGCLASGALLTLVAWLQVWPAVSLATLVASRLLLGFTQSLVGIAAISWGLNILGAGSTARMVSWNGAAAYAGMGLGAPLGMALDRLAGLEMLGALTMLLAGTGLYLAWRRVPAPLNPGNRLPFGAVLGKVAPLGASLALANIGYGTLSAFVVLYYNARGWDGAAWCLTAFATSFVGVRLLLPNLVNRRGGYPVAFGCLIVETCGLLLLWLADSPAVALLGSLMTGSGLALLYPALAVGVVARVSVANRSSALSVLAMFFDLSLGLAGALMGALATWIGLKNIFLASAFMSLASLLITVALLLQTRRARASADPDEPAA